MKLEKGERLEDLQCKGLKIIQNKDYYTFTSDSVILANFIGLKKSDTCVEIGTGCGVISILLSAKTSFKKIYAFELQSELAILAEKNIKLNNLEDKIELVHDDIKNYKKYIGRESVDVVFSNPPYMPRSEQGEDKIRYTARHEDSLSMEELCLLSSKMLRFGGKLYFVYSAERSARLIHTLSACSLVPKRMFFTENGKGKVVLVVIEATKGGRPGVKVLPNLVTNEENGDYIKLLHTKYIAK